MEEIKEPKLVAHLFEGWQETLIWSCLQQVMGELYANDAKHPTAVMALLGDFCFFAGEPDKELFYRCKEIGWCNDWVAQFADYNMYETYGLGAIILKDGEPVSGASSYTSYHGGIEIEIDTKEEYRRKGLAYICGAKLILECLERGWYPSWDAQNKWSVALAEKLGYHFDHEYVAYEVYFE